MPRLTRRRFLKLSAAALGSGAAAVLTRDLAFLQQIPEITNPLDYYPNRDWEHAYRDLNTFDSQFAFLCAPNDTHNCLLKASVRRGVVARIDASYGYGEAEDLYGNRASHRWDPRACQKGIGLARRFYGDRRVKGAFIRKGYLDWVEAGFPRDPQTGLADAAYFQRGKDEWVKVSYDEAFSIAAQAMVDIARTYSGPEGAERLRQQGYDPAIIEAMHEAGVQTLKFRGGMPFLGATRTFGLYRFANMLALLDAEIRGVEPDDALGARGWDNYSWHTDLPPGHPMVTGQQTVDFDLFTAENAKLITLWGMNWISTKMPDGHWLAEARVHGAKVVVIATEYQSTANKADAVLVIRPGTDTALALGLARVIIDEGLLDTDYVRSFTDLPLLVRMDTLQLLHAADVIPEYQPAELTNYTRVLGDSEAAPANAVQDTQLVRESMRAAWGDFVAWDETTQAPVAITRDQVGQYFAATGVVPALEGSFDIDLVDGTRVEARPVFDLVRQYLEHFDPDTVSELTRAPREGIVTLA
ncbi:MAG: molybdopterin oxidoreductase, partial [Chloroflexi bacterium]